MVKASGTVAYSDDDPHIVKPKSILRSSSVSEHGKAAAVEAGGSSSLPNSFEPSQVLNPPSNVPEVGRNRAISWDLKFSGGLQHAESFNDDISQVTENDRMTVKCLLKGYTFEDEAETYIQRSLDETPSNTVVQGSAAIFNGISDEQAELFIARERNSGSVTNIELKPRTSENLWRLAADMRQMQHSEGGSDESLLGLSTTFKEQEGATDADRFVNNAAILTQRSKSTRTLGCASVSEAAGDPSNINSKKRWGQVKAVVNFNGALNKLGKNADANPEVGRAPHGEEADERAKRTYSDRSECRSLRDSCFRPDTKADFHVFQEWIKMGKRSALAYTKFVALGFVLPCMLAAALLYYVLGNPPCGTEEECIESQKVFHQLPNATVTDGDGSGRGIDLIGSFFRRERSTKASVSWWLLFVGVRQVLTFSGARATQAFVVDFIALRTRLPARMFGPHLALWTIQSKGWPFLLFWWAVYDLLFLYGNHEFARHWLFFQMSIDLFNKNNSSGEVTSDKTYLALLLTAACLGVAVTAKRFWLGLFLGRQTFDHYAEKLADTMRNSIMIGEIATLARDVKKYKFKMGDHDRDSVAYERLWQQTTEASVESDVPSASQRTIPGVIDFTESQRATIGHALGAWEEPKVFGKKEEGIGIDAIIQFRQSLSCLNSQFPFSVAFGKADSRDGCVTSAFDVYRDLLTCSPEHTELNFDILALIAVEPDGLLNEAKLLEIVKLFRPDREGNLSLIDFVKSVDSVYK
jgi:hypothetical protein